MTLEDLCPECGDELDGFAPCACALDQAAHKPRATRAGRFTMRDMVTRKLARERAEGKR